MKSIGLAALAALVFSAFGPGQGTSCNSGGDPRASALLLALLVLGTARRSRRAGAHAVSLLSAIAFVCSIAACQGPGEPGTPCTSDEMCNEGLRCRARVCAATDLDAGGLDDARLGPDRSTGSDSQAAADAAADFDRSTTDGTGETDRTAADTRVGIDSCVPRSCVELQLNCGSVDNGCGVQIDCGACDLLHLCGGGGIANVCGPDGYEGHCTNTVQDCGETGVDCGGECRACPVGIDWNAWYPATIASCLFKVTGSNSVYCSNAANQFCAFDSPYNYARIAGSYSCDGNCDWSPIRELSTFPPGLQDAGICGVKELHYPVESIPRPAFTTEIVMFEDTLRFAASCPLTYRVEGDPAYSYRQPAAAGGWWTIGSNSGAAAVGVIHVAQYDRATVQFDGLIQSGVPELAIAHNGLCATAGARNPRPGLKIAFFPDRTEIQDIASGAIVATISEALPRGVLVTSVAVAWDTFERWLRVDLPSRSYRLALPPSVGDNNGGFGFRMSCGGQTFLGIKNVRVLWQDSRNLRLFDDDTAVRARDGGRLGGAEDYPAITLPAGSTRYATSAVDLRREKALIVHGADDLDRWKRYTIRGFAVRDLRSGALEATFPAAFGNGVSPSGFGGGGLDGFALVGCEGRYPWPQFEAYESLCWVNWTAAARGDWANFVTFAPGLVGSPPGQLPFVAFHDPSNALDGSLARYMRIPDTWRGQNHLTYHPNLLPYVTTADVAIPPLTDPLLTHTGPAGLPTQLVVRDQDRAFYETWAINGHKLHTQVRGYNVFSCSDDWAGPLHGGTTSTAPYSDYANMVPDLLRPGFLLGPLLNWNPANRGIGLVGVYWLGFADGQGSFAQESLVSDPGGWTPTQILR